MSVESDVALLRTQIDTVRVEVLVDGSLQFGNDYSVGLDALLIPATLTILPGSEPVGASHDPRHRGEGGRHAHAPRDGHDDPREPGRVAPHAHPVALRRIGDDRRDGQRRVHVRSERDVRRGRLRAVPGRPGRAALVRRGGRLRGREHADGPAPASTPSLAWARAPWSSRTRSARSSRRPGGFRINVALGVANDGICDPTGTTCYVPLDGDSPEGCRR